VNQLEGKMSCHRGALCPSRADWEEVYVFVLRDILQQAQNDGRAVGHFNIADFVMLKAVFAAAQDLKVPVIVGASEGERKFLGVRQIAALVRGLREEFDFPIFLNADHTHSLAGAVEATKAGFGSVVFDLSALPSDQNIRQTKEAIEVLKGINPVLLIEGQHRSASCLEAWTGEGPSRAAQRGRSVQDPAICGRGN